MNDPIKLAYPETCIRDGNSIPKMDGAVIETHKGRVVIADWPGICSIGLVRNEAGSSIGVLIYDPSQTMPDNMGAGVICQMTGDQARNFGASLIHLADQIDGALRQ